MKSFVILERVICDAKNQSEQRSSHELLYCGVNVVFVDSRYPFTAAHNSIELWSIPIDYEPQLRHSSGSGGTGAAELLGCFADLTAVAGSTVNFTAVAAARPRR